MNRTPEKRATKISKNGNYETKDLGNYTVNLARSNIFYPALKLSKKIKRTTSAIVENDWYRIEFDQMMDQTDSNIIISILSASRFSQLWDDGSMTFFFSLGEIQKFLGINAGKKQHWIKDKLLEMRKINIIIKSKHAHDYLVTSIVRKFRYVDPKVLAGKSEQIQKKYKVFNDNRHVYGDNTLFFVQFESEFIKMLHEDINIYCNKLMPEILKIKSGTIQAIIKFLITHKEIQISLDKLLQTVGLRTIAEAKQTPGYIYVSEQRYKQIKSEIRSQKEMLKEKFGIEITDNDLIKYKQHEDVWYSKIKVPEQIVHPIKEIDNAKNVKN